MRVRANISQAEVAEFLGVSQSAVSNWEKGRFRPRKNKVKLLSMLYGEPEESIEFSLWIDGLKAKENKLRGAHEVQEHTNQKRRE